MLIVKLTDGPHGGRFQQLSRWVEEAIGAQSCGDLTTFRAHASPRPKGEIPRVPPNNSAVWLVFRRDGQDGRYPDFVKLYERQQVSRVVGAESARCCSICDSPLGDRRRDAATCSDSCRKQRQRRKAS